MGPWELDRVNRRQKSLKQSPKNTKKIPLKFFAYGTIFMNHDLEKKQSKFLEFLKLEGFNINPLGKIVENESDLFENYLKIENKRFELDYDIDGIVYKVNNFKLQQISIKDSDDKTS